MFLGAEADPVFVAEAKNVASYRPQNCLFRAGEADPIFGQSGTFGILSLLKIGTLQKVFLYLLSK